MKKTIHSTPSAIIKSAIWLSILALLSHAVQAQSTFENIVSVFNTKCAQACHNQANPSANLRFDLPASELYPLLVNATSNNTAASQAGMQLIRPGHPYKSFLLQKAHNGLLHEYDRRMTSAMGEQMPPYGSTTEGLSNIEAETIRQWILEGAPQYANLVDEDRIVEYYTDGGFEFIDRPAPPAEGEGFQIHLGPVFLEGYDEKEWSIKYELDLPESTEVNRLDMQMNQQSHHFIIYRFNDGAENDVSQGLREITLLNNPFSGDNEMVSAWQYSDDLRLPTATAFKWHPDDVLDLNFHIPNYSGSAILPGEVFINVYTQPDGTAIKEMHSDLIFYEGIFGQFFTVPNNNQDVTLTDSYINNEKINLWMLNTHTHKYGVDYDVYLRNSNGTKGEQIFEGQVDGVYDWSHPPTKYFEPYLTIPAGQGIIQEATFNNYGPQMVTFGLTTNDEMMLLIAQYTIGDPLPSVAVITPNGGLCANDPTYYPLAVTPENATVTGTGVSGNFFIPSLAGAGQHTLTVTHNDISLDYVVEVNPVLEAPTIIAAQDLLFVEDVYENYQWSLDGTPIPGANESYYIPTANGVYSVLVSLHGCNATTISMDYAVGIEVLTSEYYFNIYPNPYKGQATIEYTLAETANVSIKVYNTLGQVISTIVPMQQQAAGQYNYPFSAAAINQPAGLYVVETTINNQIYTQKIIEH